MKLWCRHDFLPVRTTPLTHSQVQVVSLPQSSQSVQAATLVVALQALDEAWEEQDEVEEKKRIGGR